MLCPQSLRVRLLRSSVHTHFHADSSSESPFSLPCDDEGSCLFIESPLERTGPCSGLQGSRGRWCLYTTNIKCAKNSWGDLSSQSAQEAASSHTQFFTLLRGFPHQSYRSALICFTLLKSLDLPYRHFPCFRE